MVYSGLRALDVSGMCAEHARAMVSVATETSSIVLIRAPGEYVTRLLNEGYSSKGFFIKAKSCNFGPMAGFVLHKAEFSKQSLTKKGGIAGQQKAVTKAIAQGALHRPLEITESRRKWLVRKGFMTKDQSIGTSTLPGPDADGVTRRFWRFTASFGHIKKILKEAEYIQEYEYFLKETKEGNWKVLYKKKSHVGRAAEVKVLVDRLWNNAIDTTESHEASTTRGGYVTVPSTPPNSDYAQSYGSTSRFLRATAGDYDMFGSWEHSSYKKTNFPFVPENQYVNKFKRPAGPYALASYEETEKVEHPELGNFSGYLYTMIAKLNEAITYSNAPGTRQTMVHHSDECGRPKIDDVDLPIFVVFPEKHRLINNKEYVTIDTVKDFEDLASKAIKAGFKIELNPGWPNDMKGGAKKWEKYVLENNVTYGDAYLYAHDYTA